MQNCLQKPEGLPSSENTRVLQRTQNKHPGQKFCPNKKNESKSTTAHCTLTTDWKTGRSGPRPQPCKYYSLNADSCWLSDSVQLAVAGADIEGAVHQRGGTGDLIAGLQVPAFATGSGIDSIDLPVVAADIHRIPGRRRR